MTEKERAACRRINDCLQNIHEQTTGTVIAPPLVRKLELACLDVAKFMPVSPETANFALELMHNVYLESKDPEDYPYIDMLEGILYRNLEFSCGSGSRG